MRTILNDAGKKKRYPKLKSPQQPFFLVHYTPLQVPTAWARKCFDNSTSRLTILRPKLEHMWANREMGTLWWSIPKHSDITVERKVIRSWCARRARNALRQALRERGYDGVGRRIGGGDGDGKDARGLEGLRGSLELWVRREVKRAKYEALVRACGVIVDSIEGYLREGKDKLPNGSGKRAGTARGGTYKHQARSRRDASTGSAMG
ncbi:hypothetical protein AJ79_04898 [Helicocarpus griseus UAMH5409]|uniref:Uncharacterized protein n=1 Tax=Helicocarpus griseus UAMH5409 TaxID=1447875 RepID=A0A2B7XSE7_9EURO|nr:hypothetical protein AJ79_04898 [Helicocarpus griseus UAMH5409]